MVRKDGQLGLCWQLKDLFPVVVGDRSLAILVRGSGRGGCRSEGRDGARAKHVSRQKGSLSLSRRGAFEQLQGDNKELMNIPVANQCGLYGGGDGDYIPFDKLRAFFERNLS